MSDNGFSGDINELIASQPQATRKCVYPSCEAQIPADSQFTYCEKCRVLAARNAIALRIDPCVPKDMERGHEVVQNMLFNMTGDEILTTVRRTEEVLLQMMKIVRIHNIQSSSRKPFKSLSEQIDEAHAIAEAGSRRGKDAKSKSKSAENKIDRMSKLMHIDKTKAKKLLDEDYSELL